MDKRINFTKAILENLAPARKEYDVIDSKVHGLRLRVNKGGTKTYNLYRKVNRKVLRIKIANFADVSIEQARKMALKFNSEIAEGVNPQDVKIEKREEMTVKELFEIYYTQHALVRTKRAKEAKDLFDLHIIPRLGNDKISTFTHDKAKMLHISVGKDRGHAIANKVIDYISIIYNYGIRERYFKGLNPCMGVMRFKRNKRDRFLNQSELKTFFKALEKEPVDFRDFFMLLLCTGVRKSNLLAMKYSDIDLKLKRWRIDGTETKNSEVNISWLPTPAVEIIKRRQTANKKKKNKSAYVFEGTGVSGHLADPKKSFWRIKKRMKVKDETNFTIHDLRRTFGSYMAISGASLPIIGKALNHKSQISTEIYARLAQDTVSSAVEKAVKTMLP